MWEECWASDVALLPGSPYLLGRLFIALTLPGGWEWAPSWYRLMGQKSGSASGKGLRHFTSKLYDQITPRHEATGMSRCGGWIPLCSSLPHTLLSASHLSYSVWLYFRSNSLFLASLLQLGLQPPHKTWGLELILSSKLRHLTYSCPTTAFAQQSGFILGL